ncbi:hypothetical protein CC80DRAFT_567651 [Byssothecium circinans]|uniref:2EXR domain-containing protein n=1 Tax=Byssothecium circinans TaxID=147558 RepID=A0A6A5TQ92_9PLEO|nr:hypothetical protein CC80DRAFT_567651 [Byssothecium circinans]
MSQLDSSQINLSTPHRTQHTMNRNKPFPFMALPQEIRLMVYERLECEVKMHHIGVPAVGLEMMWMNKQVSLVVRSVPTSILSTCRQVREEAYKIINSIVREEIIEQPPMILTREIRTTMRNYKALIRVLEVVLEVSMEAVWSLWERDCGRVNTASIEAAMEAAMELSKTKGIFRAIGVDYHVPERAAVKFVQQAVQHILNADRPVIHIRGQSSEDYFCFSSTNLRFMGTLGVAVKYIGPYWD